MGYTSVGSESNVPCWSSIWWSHYIWKKIKKSVHSVH